MLGLYNAALLPLRWLAEGWGAWRGAAERTEWSERLAHRVPHLPPGGVWLHGASVGEAQIVTALATALRDHAPARPVAVSAQTTAGRACLPGPPIADAAFYAPLDFSGLNTRLLAALRPTALVLVETELWPNRIHEARRAGVAVVLLNARLGPERMPSYRRWSRLYGPLLDRLAAVGAQSSDDAERFRALGVRSAALCVTGNVKFDLPVPAVDTERLRRELALPAERAVLVAGSTRPGEEALVLDAFVAARGAGHDGAILILAPRHPERAAEVEASIRARGLRTCRLSAIAAGGGRDADVVLVDVIGRLGELYALARAAFVGGTLAPFGGHNLLEPASRGVPVVFGPHTGHVEQPARELERSGGGTRVPDGAALGQRWAQLLSDRDERERAGRAARAVFEAHRGALERSVALLEAVLRRTSTAPRVHE